MKGNKEDISKESIDVLLDKREPFLDVVWIKYFYVSQAGFDITNSSKGHHHP
ncbi:MULTISPECIES: hypothetical protein [Bacillaceae]|uniref:hypothetical protein n=1 Tax=Bacillaceae TaxID=186817 RepID=UPI00030A11A6|nr:hypothetical protein [Bacillus sp. T2.9-1]